MADYKRMYNDLVDKIRREHKLYDAECREHVCKYNEYIDMDYAEACYHERRLEFCNGARETTIHLLDYVQGQEWGLVNLPVYSDRVSLHLMDGHGVCHLDLDVETVEDLPRCVYLEVQQCVSGTYTRVSPDADRHMDFARESASFGVPMVRASLEDCYNYWWEDDEGNEVVEYWVPVVCGCWYYDTAFEQSKTA